MNILVIGNGFDLAHGLPTKYTDFLDFIKSFIDCYKKVQNNQIDWVCYDTRKENNAFLKKWFSSFYENDNGQSKAEKEAAVKIIEELKENIESNIWIDYFLQNSMYQKENWIDFESEISKVIRAIDDDMKSLDDFIVTLPENIKKVYIKNILEKGEQNTYRAFRDKLLDDLNKLIRALEIYLCEYVGNIKLKKKSLEIENLDIDHVLSFNYTNTHEKIYNISNSKDIEYDYIHGKADVNNTINTNNMVLGIDEYLSKKRRNKEIEFIAFKKFYQRIHKETGCRYKEWIDEIKCDYKIYSKGEANCAEMARYALKTDNEERLGHWLQAARSNYKEKSKKHNLYIFGHSLDITDKDILQDIILNDNVNTTIFYHDKDAMGQQIANLVKVIGQKELIRRTGGSIQTIKFERQQKMEEINS